MPKQHRLIKKENSLELTMEPAPPKKRPRKKIKAVWPDEQVKTSTRGRTRSLFEYSGQQLEIGDK